jgi:hypothetical protein
MLFRSVLLSLLFAPFVLFAQADCQGGRYVDYEHFANVSVTSDITYGSNTGVNGNMQSLELDIYEPVGDLSTERPVVIVAFGGSFITGSKDDVADICQTFAKLGYVAIAPEYRVGFFFPTNYTTSLAVLRGAHDLKAVVRYVHRSVQIDGNPFGLDTTRILVGGISAGAIGALHAVYLDKQSEIPPVLLPDTADFGNVSGNSGNDGFSDNVLGVWSMSGAISDTLNIEPNDVPLVSIHDVGDGVVPYYTQQVSVFAIPTGLFASGSHDIHRYMDMLGVENCLLSYPGNGHVGYLGSDYAGSIGFLVDFMHDKVCGIPADCGSIIANVNELRVEALNIFPNPTTGLLHVERSGRNGVILTDIMGKVMFTDRSRTENRILDLAGLPAGVYFLNVEGNGFSRHKVVKN